MLSPSFLSWHLRRRNQNYILDLPAFNQGAFALQKFTVLTLTTSSRSVLTVLLPQPLNSHAYIDLHCKCLCDVKVHLKYIPCTNASSRKWNRNNSVTFLLPQSCHTDHQIYEALIAQVFPSSRNLQCCQAHWPARGGVKGCKAGGEHECFGALILLIFRAYGHSKEIDK